MNVWQQAVSAGVLFLLGHAHHALIRQLGRHTVVRDIDAALRLAESVEGCVQPPTGPEEPDGTGGHYTSSPLF